MGGWWQVLGGLGATHGPPAPCTAACRHTNGQQAVYSSLGVENGVLESVLINSLAKIACRNVFSELLYLAPFLSY